MMLTTSDSSFSLPVSYRPLLMIFCDSAINRWRLELRLAIGVPISNGYGNGNGNCCWRLELEMSIWRGDDDTTAESYLGSTLQDSGEEISRPQAMTLHTRHLNLISSSMLRAFRGCITIRYLWRRYPKIDHHVCLWSTDLIPTSRSAGDEPNTSFPVTSSILFMIDVRDHI